MHRSRFLPHLAASMISLALVGASAAQTPAALQSLANFTKLADFGNGNGQYPNAPLAQGTDGNFYGTTLRGPYPSNGFAFKMTPTGTFSTFDYSCTQNDCAGTSPYSGLVLASDANFYGTTAEGGDGAYRSNRDPGGTVFQLNPQSGLSTLYSFCSGVACDDGDAPGSPLIQGRDGNLYGMTGGGGEDGAGSIFDLTLEGALSTLYSFSSTYGAYPVGGLLQATDGNFYGMSLVGGSGPYCLLEGGCGTIFKITPQGTFSTLYNFCQQSNCADGAYPREGLIQAADGNLYGVTSYGGVNSPLDSTGYGTAFKITTAGSFTSLYSFCALSKCADGYDPSGLLQATDGNFYGATLQGGASTGDGTLFKLTPLGILTTLHDFCPSGGQHCADGAGPLPLVQATDGNFYGVAGGGLSNHGIAFKLSVGLGAFVETVTASGAAGSSVIILGTNLTGASKVTFNATATAFTLVSSTEITATVPTGATTGPIVVTTPKSTLKSNKNFQITP